VVATANPFCDLPWVRRARISFQPEILPKARDEKNARRGYQLLDRDVRKAFRSERAVNDALRLVIELRKVGSSKHRDYSSSGA
jgi:hypothetical protein